MPVDPIPFNPAEALAEHLSERVRAAVSELTAAADALTGKPPAGGYTTATTALRALLNTATEQAITYDLYAGPGLASVAAALGITERTARARYDTGPRDVPLLIALDEG